MRPHAIVCPAAPCPLLAVRQISSVYGQNGQSVRPERRVPPVSIPCPGRLLHPHRLQPEPRWHGMRARLVWPPFATDMTDVERCDTVCLPTTWPRRQRWPWTKAGRAAPALPLTSCAAAIRTSVCRVIGRDNG